MQFNSNQFDLPVVSKNLIMINVIIYLGKFAAESLGYNVSNLFAMFYPSSAFFQPWQLFTHVFMHGDFMHLGFNMLGIWIFGPKLEQLWGRKRFLEFYMVSAVGSFFLHFAIVYFQVLPLLAELDLEMVQHVAAEGRNIMLSGKIYIDPLVQELNLNYNIPMLGASGAIFGLLAGFAYLFPNTEFQLLFIPFPLKSKHIALGYAGFELFSGVSGISPGIAHFAHLGGALFGFLLVKYWNKTNRKSFY